MTFQLQYCSKGVSGWFRRRYWEVNPLGEHYERIQADAAWFKARKAEGVNWYGFTIQDDGFQSGSWSDDWYSLRLLLELASTFGRCVLRHHPWYMYLKQLQGGDIHAFDQSYGSIASMLEGLDPKRIAFQPLGEPTLLSKEEDGRAVSLPAGEYEAQRKAMSDLLGTFYPHAASIIREKNPNMTMVLTPPGWGHPLGIKDEVSDITFKVANSFWAFDTYFDSVAQVAPAVAQTQAFWSARGEKWAILESGAADRTQRGTLFEKGITDALDAACAPIRVPRCYYLGPE